MYQPGVFVGGTVNWLAYEASNSSYCCDIVSLDLEKESYQKIPQPDLEKDHWAIGMFRDCLCIFASSDMFLDVCIMKEYGIKESWTKLYNVPYAENPYTHPYRKTVYIFYDDQLLFIVVDKLDLYNWKFKLVVYNSKNGNVNIAKIQHIDSLMNTNVYVESLISLPCSY
jgi:F-box interacting protein